MAARARVEFVTMSRAAAGRHDNIIRSLIAATAILAVSTSATSAGSRPTAPATAPADTYARVICLDNPVYVAWGPDPTATATNSLMLTPGVAEMIPVGPGDKLSFLEVS